MFQHQTAYLPLHLFDDISYDSRTPDEWLTLGLDDAPEPTATRTSPRDAPPTDDADDAEVF